MAYSRVIRTGNGSTNQFVVDFALGYLDQDEVTCRVGDEVDGSSDPVYRDITFLSETLVEVGGDIPGDGVLVVFERTVEKEDTIVHFSDGDVLDEYNLDISFKQILMVVHEVLDGRFGAFNQDIDMGTFRVVNLGDPVDDQDAVTKLYVDENNSSTQAAAAAASAAAAATSANTASNESSSAEAANTSATAAAASAAASASEAAGYLDTAALRTNNLSDLADASQARTNIGLGSVNNTSDLDKPVSTATASAINAAVADAVSQVRQFDTIVSAAADNIPSSVTSVMTVGAITVSDGSGWMWARRGVSEPTHAGKFQSVDGDWWEVVDAGPVPLRCFGALGDGSTNDQSAITAAFSSGFKLTGDGAVYAIDYAVGGTLNLVASLWLQDAEFKQLSSTTSGHRYDLYGTGCHNLTFIRVSVDRNGNGLNDGTITATDEIGHLNSNAGIWLESSNFVTFTDVEVYGDDSGNGIRWYDVNYSTMTNPYVHDIECIRSDMDVAIDDNITGISLLSCTAVDVHNPRVERLYVTLTNPRLSTMASGSNTLYVPEAMATFAIIGSAITVNGAGPGGAALVTTITARPDASTLTLASAASTTISNERVYITTRGPRHNRGISMGGCVGVNVYNPQIQECGQAIDLTGSLINSSCAVHGGYIRHCWSHAIKFSNAAHLCTAHGVKAEWIGMHAFLIVGTGDVGVTVPTRGSSMHGCSAHYVGAILPDAGYGNIFIASRTDISAFRCSYGDVLTTYPQQSGFFDCVTIGTGAADYGFYNNVAGQGNLNSNNRAIGSWKIAAFSWA